MFHKIDKFYEKTQFIKNAGASVVSKNKMN